MAHETAAQAPWRLLLHEAGEAAWNMAVDEALAESCRSRLSPPTLRFYTWDGPAFTIGRFQDPQKELDLEACRLESLPVVRRITGGRAVYHGRDLTYSLSSPSGHGAFPDNLQGAFLAVRRGLIEGMARLGLKTDEPHPSRPEKRRSPLCFFSISRHEIAVDGTKIAGSAQRRWKDGFLQQGSLIFSRNGQAPAGRFLRPCPSNPPDPVIRVPEDPKPAGMECWDFVTVAGQMAAGLEAALGVTLKPDRLTAREMERTVHLLETKYAQEDWNFHQFKKPR